MALWILFKFCLWCHQISFAFQSLLSTWVVFTLFALWKIALNNKWRIQLWIILIKMNLTWNYDIIFWVLIILVYLWLCCINFAYLQILDDIFVCWKNVWTPTFRYDYPTFTKISFCPSRRHTLFEISTDEIQVLQFNSSKVLRLWFVCFHLLHMWVINHISHPCWQTSILISYWREFS